MEATVEKEREDEDQSEPTRCDGDVENSRAGLPPREDQGPCPENEGVLDSIPSESLAETLTASDTLEGDPEPDGSSLQGVDPVASTSVATVSNRGRSIGVWICAFVLTPSLAAAVYLVAMDTFALGTQMPFMAGALTLLLGLTASFVVSSAPRRAVATADARASRLLHALAAGEELELDGTEPLSGDFAAATKALADSLSDRSRAREEEIRKEGLVELVRVRSQCELLVETHCARTHASKKEVETVLESERESHELEKLEWKNTLHIVEAAQRDAEERINALVEEVARLEGGNSSRGDECQRLSGEVERLLEELSSVREEQCSFVSMIASHVRGPAMRTCHAADELVRSLGSESRADAGLVEKTDDVLRAATQLDRLTDEIVDLCRLRDSSLRLVYSKVDLHRLVEQVVSETRALAARQEVKLCWDVSDELPLVSTDHALCAKVLRELVTNALRFTGRGGRVSLEVSALPSSPSSVGANEDVVDVHFRVKDTGKGISTADQDRIFGVFEQVAHAPTFVADESCGLGLAVVRGFVEHLGGELGLESCEGKGSTFYFTLSAHRLGSRPSY